MPTQSKKPAAWYKDAIIYELHVKAFFDKSGDGMGDFRGLIDKLDYLQDLGSIPSGCCRFILPLLRMTATTSPTTGRCIPITGHCATSVSLSARPIPGDCG
jgi:hypothetical protein